LAADRFPGFEAAKLANTSLYKIMIETYNLRISEVQESMQAVSTSRQEAAYLDTMAGVPAMMIRRKSFEGRKIVEYAVGIARSDRFKFEVVLRNK
jgi:DNA-binding GntR family transcriptional regulator